MPLNWTAFRQTLSDNFKNYPDSRSIEEAAEIISNAYVDLVNSGGTSSTLPPIPATIQKFPIKASLVTCFETSLNSKSILNLTPLLTVLNTVWLAAIFDITKGTPPGAINTVSVVVTTPGALSVFIPPSPADSEIPFIDALETFFKVHLSGVSGIVTALVPAAPSPVTVTFPFTYI